MAKSCGGGWRKLAIICVLFSVSLFHPLKSCEWDGDDVCSCVVKNECFRSLDLDTGLRYVDIFIHVTFIKCSMRSMVLL